MIDIIIERFIIANPSNKGNDRKKFLNKNIETYVFSLDARTYKKFELNELNNEKLKNDINEKIREAILKYYQLKNIQIFEYCKKIKN